MSDFNLYFCLGSYWVNTSRDTRLDTILDTIPDTKSGQEIRSLDQLIELKLRITELNAKESWHESRAESEVCKPGVLTQSWAEINSFEDEDPKPVPKSLIEEGSVRGRSLQSSSSTGSTRIRISLLCSLRTDRTRIFQSMFQFR